MLLRPAANTRRGVSLLEAILAASLLFITVGALHQILSGANGRARDVRDNGFAVQLCQSKINEVAAGVLQPGSTGFADFTPIAGLSQDLGESDGRESSSDYQWAMDVVKDQVSGGSNGAATGGVSLTGIWQVEVRVRRRNAKEDDEEIVVIRQLILDPSRRGSTMDTAQIAGSSTEPANNDSSGTTTTPTTGGTTTGGTTTGGGGTTGGTTGGTRPGGGTRP